MDLLIIGGGMATSRLLRELVELQFEGAITVLSEERLPCYNRILLSSILASEKSMQDVHLLEDGWLHQHGITMHCGERADKINLHRKQVLTSSLRLINYDTLILATGSTPFIPPIPGIEAENVLSFRTIEDTHAITRRSRPQSEVVIIGGGLLGLEAAYGMLKLGANPVVVNREDWLMPRQLSKSAARILQHQLEQLGMTFRLGVTPVGIPTLETQATGVSLDNGEYLSAELIIIAAGIIPNCELAKEAGIACDRGILIDGNMRTSHKNVYALGECTQLGQQLFGLVSPVYKQAESLAALLCNRPGEEFVYEQEPTRLKISGIDVVSGGLLEHPLPKAMQEQVVCDSRRGIFRRLLFAESTLVGFELIGDCLHSNNYARLLDSIPLSDETLTRLMFCTESAQTMSAP